MRVAASTLRFLRSSWTSSLLRGEAGACSQAGLARTYKDTTGIVGVEVDPEAPETLRTLLRQILREVKVIPETAQYRVSVETLTNQRLAVVSKEDLSPEKMEEEIGAGQLEELIIQAKDELSLIPKMAEWKPWDVPAGHKIKLVVHDEPVPAPEEEETK